VCNTFKRNNAKLPLLPHDIPSRPWQKLGMDILNFKNRDYLVIMDYYSKWLELKQISYKHAKEIIKILNQVFAYHGFPDVIIADNVTFNCIEFRNYLNSMNADLITSSPNHARSNGMAEKAVGISRNLLRKWDFENINIGNYLLKYRNTPIPDIGLSPAQMLLNRRLKDTLPMLDSLLQPHINDRKALQATLKSRQNKQKVYYDRTSKNLAEGRVGDNIYFKYQNLWKKGRIVKKLSEPRSYLVADRNNKIYRRTLQHLIVKRKILI